MLNVQTMTGIVFFASQSITSTRVLLSSLTQAREREREKKIGPNEQMLPPPSSVV